MTSFNVLLKHRITNLLLLLLFSYTRFRFSLSLALLFT